MLVLSDTCRHIIHAVSHPQLSIFWSTACSQHISHNPIFLTTATCSVLADFFLFPDLLGGICFIFIYFIFIYFYLFLIKIYIYYFIYLLFYLFHFIFFISFFSFHSFFSLPLESWRSGN